MITVDGTTYDFICDITRTAEIKASELSGMLLNKKYFNDPLATYMKYNVTMAVPITKMTEYAELYEILTDPIAEHTFILPYNQSVIQLEARVETVSDSYYRGIWRRTTFDVISNEPTKVP